MLNMSRTPKPINWDLIEKRLEARASVADICHMHNMDTDTFYSRFRDYYGFNYKDNSARFHSAAASNILFTQYMKALSGNTHMLTLLGREWCGQGKEDDIRKSPFEDLLELKHENMILKAELDAYKSKTE